MIAVNRRAMGNDGDVVGGAKRDNAPGFGDATTPSNVGLQNVGTIVRQQLMKSVTRILVFTCSHQGGSLHGLFEGGITTIIIRNQTLLNPFNIVRFTFSCQLLGVGNSQAHVTINHQWKIRADRFAPFLDELDIFAHTLVSLGRSKGQGKLGAVESQLLGMIWTGCRGIDGHAFLGFSAQQGIHGQSPQMTQGIPEGQIHGGNGLKGQSLASIIHGGTPTLIPNQFDIAGILPFNESRQVMFHHVTGSRSANGNAHAHHAIGQFNFHDNATHGINAPTGAGGAVLAID
mmetsp:Transcript_6679/g.13960  ORF Transcript_6679/g.13960 Transcript_6679/m.13960 type:complete len:288 (+) Transcript_6679:342-1205(+)